MSIEPDYTEEVIVPEEVVAEPAPAEEPIVEPTPEPEPVVIPAQVVAVAKPKSGISVLKSNKHK